jgi:nucleotide-binding universal stress UspA family protein
LNRSGQRPVILVGVGASGASLPALAWAAREARRRGATLRAIHVWQPHPARAPYAGAGSPAQLPSQPAAAARLVAEVRSVLGDAADTDFTAELIDGIAERVLIEASADADLLVLGAGEGAVVASGDPRIPDRPVGPVIRACLNYSHCPVLIITSALAAEQGLAAHRPQRDALAATA